MGGFGRSKGLPLRGGVTLRAWHSGTCLKATAPDGRIQKGGSQGSFVRHAVRHLRSALQIWIHLLDIDQTIDLLDFCSVWWFDWIFAIPKITANHECLVEVVLERGATMEQYHGPWVCILFSFPLHGTGMPVHPVLSKFIVFEYGCLWCSFKIRLQRYNKFGFFFF